MIWKHKTYPAVIVEAPWEEQWEEQTYKETRKIKIYNLTHSGLWGWNGISHPIFLEEHYMPLPNRIRLGLRLRKV